MTDLIMNLVDSYGFAENRQDDGQALYARNLVEVKIAELTAERDAYAAAADTMAMSHKVERDGLLTLHTEQINYTVKIAAERDALKDAAKLALDVCIEMRRYGNQRSVAMAIGAEAALKALL